MSSFANQIKDAIDLLKRVSRFKKEWWITAGNPLDEIAVSS